MNFEMVSRQEKMASEQNTLFWKPVWVSWGMFSSVRAGTILSRSTNSRVFANTDVLYLGSSLELVGLSPCLYRLGWWYQIWRMKVSVPGKLWSWIQNTTTPWGGGHYTWDDRGRVDLHHQHSLPKVVDGLVDFLYDNGTVKNLILDLKRLGM